MFDTLVIPFSAPEVSRAVVSLRLLFLGFDNFTHITGTLSVAASGVTIR